MQVQVSNEAISLIDDSTNTNVEIFSFGAVLNSFSITGNGTRYQVIDGYKSLEDAKATITAAFKSAKLSPFVCRIREGRYSLNGKQYKVEKFYLGEHAIHGLVFDLPYEVVETRANDDEAMVVLKGKYDGADNGYPFPFELNIGYKLQTGNKLSVTTSVTNLHHESIPYTDGWHPYFTLGGSVDEWTLQFNGRERYGLDEDFITNLRFDEDARFENGLILANISLDHTFKLKTPGRCLLKNARLSLAIEPEESYPVMQVFITDSRKSIAIENLSGPPDNFNNGMHLHLLQPGETKSFSASYTLTAL